VNCDEFNGGDSIIGMRRFEGPPANVVSKCNSPSKDLRRSSPWGSAITALGRYRKLEVGSIARIIKKATHSRIAFLAAPLATAKRARSKWLGFVSPELSNF
jgi:hypothetical protein